MTDFTPGQTITTTHKGIEHVCTVVDTPDGVRFDVDGTQYTSLSKAAQAVAGWKPGTSVDGPRFWGLRSPKAPAEPKAIAPPAEDQPEPTAKPKRGRKAKAAAPEAEAEQAPDPTSESNDPVDLFE